MTGVRAKKYCFKPPSLAAVLELWSLAALQKHTQIGPSPHLTPFCDWIIGRDSKKWKLAVWLDGSLPLWVLGIFRVRLRPFLRSPHGFWVPCIIRTHISGNGNPIFAFFQLDDLVPKLAIKNWVRIGSEIVKGSIRERRTAIWYRCCYHAT